MGSRRTEGALFIGRLSKNTRVKDLEDIFESYGKMTRCEVKYSGAEMAYGFVDFEDRRDAEDALRYENGRSVCGSSIIVEWAKGSPRVGGMGGGGGYGGGGSRDSSSECYRCHRVGHMARDCPEDGGDTGRRGGRPPYRPGQREKFRERSRSRSRDRR